MKLTKYGHEAHCNLLFPAEPDCVCTCAAKSGLKVIVAGSRDVTSLDVVRKAVKDSLFKVGEIVSGKARGVDTLGEEVAKELGVSVKAFPADWNGLGRKAGPLRNIQMGDYADALVAIRLDNSRGTTHMITYMEKLGKPVFVVDLESAK